MKQGIRIISTGQWGNTLGQLLFAVRFAEVHQCKVTVYVDWTYYDIIKDFFVHPQVVVRNKPKFVYVLLRRFLKVRYTPAQILANPRPGKYYCVYGHMSNHGWTLDELRLKIRSVFPYINYRSRQAAVFIHYRSFMLSPYYTAGGIDSSVIIPFLHTLNDKHQLPLRLFMDFSSRSPSENPDWLLYEKVKNLPFVETNNSNSTLLEDWKMLFQAEKLVITSGSSFSALPAVMNDNTVYLIGSVNEWPLYKLIGAEYIDLASMSVPAIDG